MGELPPEFFPYYARQLMPGANNATITKIQAQYDYSDEPARLAWDSTTDVMFAINANNIANAFKNRTRRYIMSTPPATHGLDVNCTPPFPPKHHQQPPLPYIRGSANSPTRLNR